VRPVNAASAWTRADVPDPATWSLDAASARARLADDLRGLLFDGPGFALVRGVPVAGAAAELESTLLGLGALLGRPLPQDGRGSIVDAVRDERSRGVRGAKTNRSLPYHTDMAHVVPDAFILLAVRQARGGGESRLVSGHTAANELLRTAPDRLARLGRDFQFDRSQDAPPGESPVQAAPVFQQAAGVVSVRYNRARIHRGHRISGRPLSEEDEACLDALDEVLATERYALDLFLKPGDALVVNNRVLLHARTAFTDDEAGLGRLLLRHWIAIG
jgi:alpha-ketoglutarate-dependent taurine dioxygenase